MLKIEKNIPIGPKRVFKRTQQEQLIAVMTELQHMQSVRIPHKFLSAQSVRNIAARQFKKWRGWAYEVRLETLNGEKGCRLWAINKHQAIEDAQKN